MLMLRSISCAPSAPFHPPVGLHQFGAALPAFRPEGRSDLARLLKLIVPVIGKAGAHPEAVEKAAHPHLAAPIHARMAHVNPHFAVLVVFLFPLPFVVVILRLNLIPVGGDLMAGSI